MEHLLRLHPEERSVIRHGEKELDFALAIHRHLRRGEGIEAEVAQVGGFLQTEGKLNCPVAGFL